MAKLTEVEEKPAMGAVPVPFKLTVCVPPEALSVAIRVADLAPLVAVVKVKLMVHDAPAVTVVPQVLVWMKEAWSVPLMTMLVMIKDAEPVLVRVTIWAGLVVLMSWLPKESDEGDMSTVGAAEPMPLKLTV